MICFDDFYAKPVMYLCGQQEFFDSLEYVVCVQLYWVLYLTTTLKFAITIYIVYECSTHRKEITEIRKIETESSVLEFLNNLWGPGTK